MSKYYIACLVLGLHFVLSEAADTCSTTRDPSPELLLHKDLLCDYQSAMRPRKHSNEAVNVTIRMLLKTFMYTHEYASIGVLNVGSWVVMIWKDDFLSWNPDKYGGLKDTVFQSTQIWMPDLSLYNSPDPERPRVNKPCLVNSDGWVTCIPHLSLRAVCASDYKRWPYDQQNCSMKFGTWMQKGEEVNFVLSKSLPVIDSRNIEPNKFWKLVQTGADRHDGVFACCPNNTYPTVNFWLNIQRHAASKVAFMLTPAIVMIALTLSSLWLDLNSVERMILMLLNVYFHITYIQEISTVIPGNGDDLPNAVIYFRDSTLLSCAVLLEGIALRSMIKKKSVTYRWISIVTGFMNTGAGKIIMFHEFDPAIGPIVSEDAENQSKEEVEKSANEEWVRFALIINRFFFILVCITYIALVLKYLL